MKRDMLDAADQLRNQLGLFYWTLQHGGDVTVALRQLHIVAYHIQRETTPWCLAVPQTLFARWNQLQLTLLLNEARQVLKRMDCDLPTQGGQSNDDLVGKNRQEAVFPAIALPSAATAAPRPRPYRGGAAL